MSRRRTVTALEARLRACRNVETLGVRPNFCDYPPEAAERIRRCPKLYYPTEFYAALFDAMGKPTFPSVHTYRFAQDKIRQTALFQLLAIPHPVTRVFYGRRQQRRILEMFRFPFIGKVPRGSALGRGVFLIRNQRDLEDYLSLKTPAYIQQYHPAKRDIRVVVIGNAPVLAFWRVHPDGDHRSNLAVGGTVSLESVPAAAVALAVETARRCRWDDVAIDLLPHAGAHLVLEANVKYGREGFRQAGIDYTRLMERLIDAQRI
jgi:ribosomal protein S6--L-glutamate ligase